MTQVSFYTLGKTQGQGDDAARLLLACRISEKAVSLGHRVFIHAESSAQARELDQLLWQFRPGSFVPHGLLDEDLEHPVTIAAAPPPDPFADVLINLSGAPCTEIERFSRINEIVGADRDSLARGRDWYRHYQAAGYQPETHKL